MIQKNQSMNLQVQGNKSTYTDIKDFVTKTRALLVKEQSAEKEDFQKMTSSKSALEIQEQGAGLSNMVVVDSKQGFYDRIIITLTKSYYSEKNKIPIPEHCKLQVGDDVAIYNGDKMIGEGIIYRRTPEKIKISINVEPQENQDYEDLKVNIILKWNEVTYRRYFQILDILENPYEPIPLENLFFQQSAKSYRPKNTSDYINQKMNQQQNIAISNGLVQKCHLIHGPPGTGKTTTVCSLIVEAVKKGQKVLACAPSNIAVDNIIEGVSNRVSCVRIGNPARMSNEVIQKCLDFIISKKDGQWKGQEKKLNACQKKLKRTKVKSERKQIYNQMKGIRKELKLMQQQVIQQILEDANVICCTNAGAADRVFKKYFFKRKFDLLVIDQCGQGLQVSCWIPISKAKRVVLAGDHKQLPPTIKFQQDSLLGYTLFSRCMQQLTYITSTMLQVQYRMNKRIMGWSNSLFYENRLKADKSVENHTIQQIYSEVNQQEGVLLFIDTAGCHIGQEGGVMESKMNIGQGDIAAHIYEKLLNYGVKYKDIAILTPYSKQVTLIKNTLLDHQTIVPEISTVDGIQGRQKQCIIISMVRSNPQKQIGFLKDWRRMNVAVTRARRMLVVIGDSDCITADKNIKSLIDWIGEHGSIQSAQQLKGEQRIRFGLGKTIQKSDFTEKQKIKSEQQKTKAKKEKKGKKDRQKEKEESNDIKKKSQKMHSVEEQTNLKQSYRALLQSITEETTINDLNAYQRKMMHEVAEQLGYTHITSQDKSKIVIAPKVIPEELTVKQKKKKIKGKDKQRQKTKQIQNLADLVGDQSSDQQPFKKVQQQEQPNKEVLPTVPLDHTGQMENLLQIAQQEQKPIQPKKKKKNKAKNEKQQKDQNEQEDWEKILEQFKADLPKKDQCNKCHRKLTSVTAIQCRFCNLHFCRHDVLAEEHGCEDAAREDARKPRLDNYLQEGARKIKEKLKQQQDQRRKKVKEKEKKK